MSAGASLEECWHVNQAAIYKVRLLDRGTNSHVISTRLASQVGPLLDRYEGEFAAAFTLHAATIRNGVLVADVEVMSTISEDEANKDLEFFLEVMHQRTLKGRG